jgi:hypothetical protein
MLLAGGAAGSFSRVGVKHAFSDTESILRVLRGGDDLAAGRGGLEDGLDGIDIRQMDLADGVGNPVVSGGTIDVVEGAGSKVGDFNNLTGATVDEVLDRIPKDATMRELTPVKGGASEGFEYKWIQDGQTYRARVHNVDVGAPAGSNAANGWTMRIQRGRQYYDYTIEDFQPAKFTNPSGDFFDEAIMNNTHIPINVPQK